MAKLKETTTILLCALLALIVAFTFFGCSENAEDKKYDVAIRVGCSDGNIYEFPVGEDEKHIFYKCYYLIEVKINVLIRVFNSLCGSEYLSWILFGSSGNKNFRLLRQSFYSS